jgi:uncharacterized protein (TIRG00374 family)
MIGYVVNYALPRVGEVSRCGVATKYDQVPFSTALGTVILERILDLICLLIVFVLTLFFQFDELKVLTQEHILNPISDLSHKVANQQSLFVSLIVLFILTVTLTWVYRKKIKSFLGSKFGKIISEMVEGLRSIWKLEKPFQFIFQSVMIWFLYFLGLYSCMFCLPETAKLSAEVSLAVLLFSTFGVIVSPGGIGAYQLISTAVLLYYGVEQGIAYAFPWIAWLSQLVSILIIGLICFISLPFYNQTKNVE